VQKIDYPKIGVGEGDGGIKPVEALFNLKDLSFAEIICIPLSFSVEISH
jgi:hypothetical protein